VQRTGSADSNPAMQPSTAELRPYQPPRLKVYGTVTELTLTVNLNKNKNDAIQGGNNLKT
jgi:hypothetical protein